MRPMSSFLDYLPKEKPKEERVNIRITVPKKLHEEMTGFLEKRRLTWQKFLIASIQAAKDEFKQRPLK